MADRRGRWTGSGRRRPGRSRVDGFGWRAAPACAGGLVLALAGAAALESAAFEPFAFTIEDALKRLTTGRAAKPGLVAARLWGRFVTAGSIAQRRRRKNVCCVTTRLRNFWFFRWLWRRGGSATACLLGLGMLGPGGLVLPASGLSPGRQPSPDPTQAVGVLAVTLVPASRRVLAPTAFAQAEPRSRTPTGAAVWLMMTRAHGRVVSQGSARGGTNARSSSGAYSKTATVYSCVQQANREGIGLSPARPGRRTEQNREGNRLRNALRKDTRPATLLVALI